VSSRLHPGLAALLWAVAVISSIGLSALSVGRPRPPEGPPDAPSRPRPLLPAERATLEAEQRALARDLAAARDRLGRWPRVEELEGNGPDGAPLLPHGLPDNPAAEAVGWVIEGCGPLTGTEPPADWRWCPDDGTLIALGLPPR
jgi:hypothetical protein